MLGEYVVLCLAAALGGGINAVAGGGTLLTFPALIAVLKQSHADENDAKVWANATSTVALFPASITALWGFRREFVVYSQWAKKLVLPSLVGGTLGAVLTAPGSLEPMWRS